MINPLKITVLCALLFVASGVKAQHQWIKGKYDTIVVQAYVYQGDTIPHIWLKEVMVSDYRIWKSDRQRDKYNKLKRDVLKVLPYAKYAGYRYRQLEYQLLAAKNDAERKQMVKQCEDEIKRNFERDIRNMTIKQGAILIKLIDRETGRTSYVLLKDLKNGLTAFFWQSIASVFGNSLKEHYDPVEDYEIENIIQSVGDPDYMQAYNEYYKYLSSQGIKY
ncbi:DUF4294 domain-containing protein [Solitalea longa]|uniref:DUF4294 domain-containing protein n=1 Tax=Solitalea longa TaxID=2079460 RepID=A0A2S4ZY39_9SPHI|nr:DUF4294 domain-containing protein [Solitalea longa]POY35271.1 DUF4294 domain-containing protein [Solitalea longa]